MLPVLRQQGRRALLCLASLVTGAPSGALCLTTSLVQRRWYSCVLLPLLCLCLFALQAVHPSPSIATLLSPFIFYDHPCPCPCLLPHSPLILFFGHSYILSPSPFPFPPPPPHVHHDRYAQFCANSSVVEPTPCSANGTCNATSCPQGRMPYCPGSSTVDGLCPAVRTLLPIVCLYLLRWMPSLDAVLQLSRS